MKKEYRNKGIGTQLIQAIIDDTRSMGVKSLSERHVARNLET
ncbi:GNAT family N-acetyltransferase [Candidatus Bathyarchaeota archaeon]|nr:GNAT family N-acetyltransferase [Candidatus Bathyarchaeota archaeon]